MSERRFSVWPFHLTAALGAGLLLATAAGPEFVLGYFGFFPLIAGVYFAGYWTRANECLARDLL